MVFSIIVTVIAFGIMVMLHEAGHFFAARRFGVTVHEFSIGMGPLLFARKKKETQYSVRLLPLGGYVKLEGEEEESDDPRAFGNIHPLKRICVLAAGAAMNVILGFLCFVIITVIMGAAETNVIGKVIENSPADLCGLEPGDKIVRLGNTSIGMRDDIDLYMMGAGDSVDVTVKRGSEKLKFSLKPMDESGRKIIGIIPEVKELGVIDTAVYSAYRTRYVVRAVFFSLGQLFTGKAGVKDLSGPVGIVKVVDDTTEAVQETGASPMALFVTLLNLFGMISVNLGIFNLLPFPALDGGSIIFAFIELVTRKKQNRDILGYINLIGLALILGLGIFVMWSDIVKIIGG